MFRKILKHKITFVISVVAFVLVIIGSVYFLFRRTDQVLTNVPVVSMNVQETISTDGKVDSDKHVTLAFKKAGTVTAVNVKVGDVVTAGKVLSTMDPGQLRASLDAAKADVLSAQANLTSLQKGATNQTRAVYNQNVSTAKLALATAVRDAYLKIQDAYLNKVGFLYNNNTSVNPVINIPTDSYKKATDLNQARLDVTTRMARWNSYMTTDPTSDQTLTEASNDIAAAKSLINLLSDTVNALNPDNSGMSQSVISYDVASVNGAASEINAAESGFNTALQAYKTSGDQLSVIQASSTPEAIQIAKATLAKAQANVSSIQSQISDTVLTAPWDGVIASVNPKVGENFAANAAAIDVISPGAYKIDVMIPENEVASISVGDHALIKFDASGSGLMASGTVTTVDLAPTITNGVAAYKATVYLNSPDEHIRTGMTGNVTIYGASVTDATAIPSSSVIIKNDGSYVLVLANDGSYVDTKVVTGVSGGGYTQIISGLVVGDRVASFGASQ